VLFIVVHGVAFYKGVNGQRLLIPTISDFADKF